MLFQKNIVKKYLSLLNEELVQEAWKKNISFSLFLLLSVTIMAQTQQGVVKTRGKMVNGVLQKGTPLAGATIQIKDRSAMVSGNDGKFSFPIQTNTYLLLSVKKNGYQLVDQEACRDYKYSANPLYLVMETPEQKQADLLEAQRKIRRTLQKQLQTKEEEIEALQISLAEKQQLLEKLYKDQEDNEKLIGEMAKRYAEMDYDQLDDLNRKINDAIINGRLTQADSLLRSKGDIQQRILELEQHEQANAKMRQELEKSEAFAQQKRADLINDCYNRYELCKMQHEYDSAAYYICLRADLDTLNLKNQIDAASFLRNQKQIAGAKKYSLRSASLLFDYTKDGLKINWGHGTTEVVFAMMDFAETLFYYDNESDVGLKLYEIIIKSVDQTYENLKKQYPDSTYTQIFWELPSILKNKAANLYLKAKQNERSEQLYNQTLDRLQQYKPENDDALYHKLYYCLISYEGLARLNYLTNRYAECEQVAGNAMSIIWKLTQYPHDKEEIDINNMDILRILGALYRVTKRYEESEKAYLTQIDIIKPYAQNNPQKYESSLAYEQRHLSHLYLEMKRYSDCAALLEQALPLFRKLSAEEPQLYIGSLGTLSYCRVITCQYAKAEQYAREALSVDSTQLWIGTNLAAAILMQGRYVEAEQLYRQLKGEKKETLLGDLQAYAEAGAIPKEREEDVEKIKRMLNE